VGTIPPPYMASPPGANNAGKIDFFSITGEFCMENLRYQYKLNENSIAIGLKLVVAGNFHRFSVQQLFFCFITFPSTTFGHSDRKKRALTIL
jgi:hypothetical protein